jgi:hypothetical protein
MDTLAIKHSLNRNVLIALLITVVISFIPVSVVLASGFPQYILMGMSTNAHLYVGMNGVNDHFYMQQFGSWIFGNQSVAVSTVNILNFVPVLFIAAIIIIAINMAMTSKLDLKALVWMAVFIFIGFALLIVINGGLRLIGVF